MNHGMKIIAPVLVAVLAAGYYVGLFLLLHYFQAPLLLQLGLALLSLMIVGCMVYVVVQRIREIKSGEEDDLDQY